jgi:RNA polymerase sigma-70 factor (ECF subfamily)
VDYERADSDIKLDRLDRAIVRLPPFYREPLLLILVSGLSHAEAAQILNTTPKAIEMRLRRARQQLSTLLDEGPEG